MANVRSGNSHYVDSTGALTTETPTKLAGVVLIATAANAVLVLRDYDGTVTKLELRLATSGDSQHFDFSNTPVFFPNGINATTVTNARAILIYT